MESTARRAVAIVGLGAVLPDAPNVAAFWHNICASRYSIIDVPPERWSIADYYDPDPRAPDKTYSKIGSWVRGFEFDWRQYRIPPRVSAAMDESQKWAVTIASEALADYGYPKRTLDLERTGVVLGTAMGGEMHYLTNLRIAYPEYARALSEVSEFNQLPESLRNTILAQWRERVGANLPPVTEDSMPGELANVVSGRVANVLDLRGPNFITDAACASSFAAVLSAMELLERGHCDAVLAGGVDRNMGAASFVKFCKIGALSPTGTRPFAEGADGFVMGEGAAAFLLKRLADAERDGDHVYAVIRGVGGSSDGRGKGITAPNPQGQRLAIRRAWENAGLDPATATLVEAHGTSTRVGDVVEVESLAHVFQDAGRSRIALGSVKSNIGHLKSGAGAAGLLKTTLALCNKVLPPTLNAARPNSNIDFPNSPFYLNGELGEWGRPNGVPRRAGVSAYGFGGTNFHLVMEEHVPGSLTEERAYAGVTLDQHEDAGSGQQDAAAPAQLRSTSGKPPLRGILALGANDPSALAQCLRVATERVQGGWSPPLEPPDPAALAASERLVIDFGDRNELQDRLAKAGRALAADAPGAWKALAAQGVFRGQGTPGKMAFLFPGQGSQYLNMGRELAAREPVVAEMFAEADRVMTPILGKPLTAFIFVDSHDPDTVKQAELELLQTAITQPAMLAMDAALQRLLGQYGFAPDVVMGHSLGEYGALIAAGVLPFADALEAVAARGREMTRFSVADNGWMAAVMAPPDVVERTLAQVDGYVVAANINSRSQCVIGGASQAVARAIEVFGAQGYDARRIPVSHAFHTEIVAPASKPLRAVLDRLHVYPPQLPVIANVTGEPYPTDPDAIRAMLERQVASPVQWVKGLETLQAMDVRTFVEVGPKKALKGFTDDVLGDRTDIVSLFTNHPKTGELPSFNQALCGLYAAGYGASEQTVVVQSLQGRINEEQRIMEPTSAGMRVAANESTETSKSSQVTAPGNGNGSANGGANGSAPSDGVLGQALLDALRQLAGADASPAGRPARQAYDRNEVPLGSVVISGAGLGLPGADKAVMDPDNALRILRGEQFVDLIPERFRKKMLAKRITRVVKAEDGSGSFETIDSTDDVIRLAGRAGYFDLAEEYGVPEKLVEALDTTSQLAMAAGLDALREAGIPLVQTWKYTSTGKYLPDRWLLPEALRDETGVIFCSALPGIDRFADELERYFVYQNRLDQLDMLERMRERTIDSGTLLEIQRMIAELQDTLAREPYVFDRRFLFRVLAMGHSQFAEYVGARGPNTQVNAACASTAQGIALAEDWIRAGRCRRVLVIGADHASSDHLMEWVGAGFVASGAAATDDRVEDAALPFDRRRHGTIIGMGACALVVESEDAVRERGMRGIAELLSSETSNSAFHGTRLDVNHISQVMNSLITSAELRFGIDRYDMAAQTVFMSHETFTPARGGSASAEVAALRQAFGEAASEIVMANTKGFIGHPMGVGVEDVIALKILEYGIVPPVPNFREVDPDLGTLNLSRGGRYPVRYAIHLAAGFGSQIAMTLTRRIPGGPERVDNEALYRYWLAAVSGLDAAETEVVKRVLRIKANGGPGRPPAPSTWRYGLGPAVRAAAFGSDQYRPLPAGASAAPVRSQAPARNGQGLTRSAETPAPAPQTGVGSVSAAPLAPAPAISQTPVPAPAPSALSDEPPSRAPAVEAAPPATVGQPVQTAEAGLAAPEAPTIAPAAVDPVTTKVLATVAEKTGYPPEMLDLDLDLEADLGVDTVKQAETFVAIREAFAIPRQDNLRLRDYPTLAHVIGFVYEMRPDLAPAAQQPLTTTSPQANAPAEPSAAVHAAPAQGLVDPVVADSVVVDPVVGQVTALVAEKTGYPQDMLDLDLDLEADLGVDTVKQAETFVAIRQTFGIPRQDNLRLRDYPTLAHVVRYVHENRPDLAPAQPTPEQTVQTSEPPAPVPPVAPAPTASVSPAAAAPPAADAVADKVLALVAEKTGYPQDMLDLDLDLEADLGVDTVKQAETFAAIRQTFDIPRQENLKLRDYPTLGHVIRYVYENRPDLAALSAPSGSQAQATIESPVAASLSQPTAPLLGSLAEADRIPRRAPVPVLRPALDLCKGTNVTLGEGSRVVVGMDESGVGQELAAQLVERGVTVLSLQPGLAPDHVTAQAAAWLAEGPVQGVYWLPALDVERDLEQLDLDGWRTAVVQRVKNLYALMRALYEAVNGPGTFLVSATRLGGLHGYGPEGATAPLGGAVTGFTKAYKRERPEVLVKAVDLPPAGLQAPEIARQLIGETLSDSGAVEIGWQDGLRYAISLEERSATDGLPGMELNRNTVFLVTGAAGGITSAIVADLAGASAGTFYLLDLVAQPQRDDEQVVLFRKDREALKQKLIESMKAAGERPTPARVEKQILAIERSEAALRAIEAVEAAGGTALYRSVNLLDGPAIAEVVEEVRQQHGRIDVVLHAGGLEISRSLPEKEPREFDLVFDVKTEGLFNLLHAAHGLPLGAVVAFSSVAGRFGNAGQTDYSAANDLLCKVTSSLRRWRPDTRGIAIDWTAWGGIGMATRGSIPKIMEMAGIDMLPPEAGVPTIRRELTSGSTRGEIVVGQRLGILTAELDETGGLDPQKVPAGPGGSWPMIGHVKGCSLHEGLEVETLLDPKVQPFLYDHQIEGTPLLPGAMGLETFAELARLLAPDYHIQSIDNARFLSPFKFYRQQPRTMQLRARLVPLGEGALLAHTSLRSVTQPGGNNSLPPQVKEHFTAEVRLAGQLPVGDARSFTPPAGKKLDISAEEIYKAYFHGPAYQVLARARVDAEQAVGLLAEKLPADTEGGEGSWLAAPRLIELCFQTAGLWQIKRQGVMALPMAVARVIPYRQLSAASGHRLYAVVSACDNGATFDAQVVDEAGAVYVTVQGYRTVALTA